MAQIPTVSLKRELDIFYETPDPWEYQTTVDDLRRKQYILHTLRFWAPYTRAIDLGCGEAWITQDLPAPVIHGYELSDLAASRFPAGVQRVLEPDGGYDLIMATGVLYKHYDWQTMLGFMRQHATGIVLTCNIKAWELPEALPPFTQLLEMEFPYREFVQKLRVFRV